ncbi:unnamed protein product [Rotaria magnacalcarata]|uniref:F-box domain-containing protein n=1 Tax=Rotaria magnacalcarata TaxID=392030 RepID=A0A815ZQM0_9BILA|nr:unnamed protein product [Rotaria magnacalcarata]CAF1585553.1 unnamed protein product [Rotaria magnacalcarata]CAF2059309.1 unnamed protein product [Rotaria magnacalcarata]CAF3840115.1 unnamed protein product [Rotaria magnacalcarata]CAF3903713.1 unnamed protein product [Rotaria magnacalcarata]
MNLEFLPNELLFNLFDYLNILDLFKAFYSLNSQFNPLILAHCHQCRLDFRSTNKTDFDIIYINFANRNYFPIPTVISQSLKHLSIPHISCYFKELIHLFKVTPNLQHLTINFLEYANQFKPVLSILSITHLKLSFDSSLEILHCILQNSPDRLHLTLEIYNIYMDGYQWEDMIRRYLSKLKIFRFKMRFSSLNDESKEIQSNQIFESFRAKFWIDDHQWFVRCHWYSSDEQYRLDFIDLFTLPYTFKDFLSYTGCTLAKSTCPTDDQYWSFDQVNNLCYGSSHFKSSIVSRIRFSHIEYLSLRLPFNDQFLSVVSTLDRLTLSCISVNNHKKPDNILSQMQMLLDRAPNLLSLSIFSFVKTSNFLKKH